MTTLLIIIASVALLLCTLCEAAPAPSASATPSTTATISYGKTTTIFDHSSTPSVTPNPPVTKTPSPSTSSSISPVPPTITPTPSSSTITTVSAAPTPTATITTTTSTTATTTPSVTHTFSLPLTSPTRTPQHSIFASTTPTPTTITSPTASHTSTISPTVSHSATVSPSTSPSPSYTPSPQPVRHDCLFTPRVYNIVFSALGSSLLLYKNGVLIGGTSARTHHDVRRSSRSAPMMRMSQPSCEGREAKVHSVWTELRVGDVLSVMAKPTGVSSEMRESKVKGSVKSARQVISNETEEEHEEAKQAPEYKRMYPTTTSKTTREDILPNQNPGFILAVENVILTGRDAFYAKGIKQLIDDGEGHRWNTPSFDACHWHTTSIVSTRHHQIAKNNGEDSNSDSYSDSVLCDSELPATWGTDQWEFSKGARYIWGPDKSAKMLFLRTTIGETCMTPVTSTTSSTNGSPGSNAVGSGSTNQQQQGKGEQDGTIPKQIPISESVLMVSVSGQADIYINGLLIRRLSSSSCHSVTQIVVPHSAALGTASFYTGAVIGIHAIVKPSRHRNHPLHFTSTSSTTRGSSSVIDGAQGGIIVAAGPQLVMTGRDPVRVLSRNEVSALGFKTSLGRTHLWASDQYDACSWHVATTLSVFADGNQWCRPDSFGTKEKGWPFPREARYVWHPDRTERDVFMRVTIGGDEDKCAKQMARLSGRTDATVGVVKGLRQREQYYSGDRDGVVVDQMKTELVKGVEQERDLRTPGSLNGYYISSAADKFMKEERYMRQNVQSLPHPVITRGWACSASGTLPVLFSTPGTAKLYVNGHHIATHRNGLAHPDACQSHTTAYIRAKHGTVVTFYVTGAAQASALGLVAAIGGWYVTGHDQRWRMSHARRAHNWISPEYDACHDFGDQQMIVTDKIRCKAKTLPRELDAQYVWSTTRTEFLYVRLSIGESCAA